MKVIVPGRPVPYKRTTQKQKYVDEQYKKYASFKEFVQHYAKMVWKGKLLTCHLWVEVTVYLYGKDTLMGNDGDVDNYAKSALDACNNIIYVDDRQVIKVIATKLPAKSKDEERMEIDIDEFVF